MQIAMDDTGTQTDTQTDRHKQNWGCWGNAGAPLAPAAPPAPPTITAARQDAATKGRGSRPYAAPFSA